MIKFKIEFGSVEKMYCASVIKIDRINNGSVQFEVFDIDPNDLGRDAILFVHNLDKNKYEYTEVGENGIGDKIIQAIFDYCLENRISTIF